MVHTEIRPTFTIGVTGHRDLAESCLTEVADRTGKFLASIRTRLPGVELVLMSGMADGADRLAARCAIDNQIRVVALLPMERQAYEEDFSAQSLTEFHAFLGHPLVRTVELPGAFVETAERGSGQALERDACYKNLSRVLIQKSNLLLALWDGTDTGLIGGTSDVVLSYLGGFDAHASPTQSMQYVPPGAQALGSLEYALWVPVRRRSAAREIDVPTAAVFLSGIKNTKALVQHQRIPEGLSDRIEQLADYCADARVLTATGKGELSWGLPDHPVKASQDDPENLLQRIETEFIRADGLAIFFQGHSDRMFKAFSFVGALLGLLFLVYGSFPTDNMLLYGYIAVFVASYIVYHWAHRQRWLLKHVMYRLLAEVLRVRFFLRRTGAEGLVDAIAIARFVGIDRLDGFDWILQLLKSVAPRTESAPESVERSTALLAAVKADWVDDQAGYFARKIRVMRERNRRVEGVKSLLVTTVLVVIVALICFEAPLLTAIPGGEVSYKSALVFLMGLFPFWLAVWELYHDKMATTELLWQYRNQAETFAVAAYRLEQTDDSAERRKVVSDLATHALLESYQWAIQRIQREHDPPSVV